MKVRRFGRMSCEGAVEKLRVVILENASLDVELATAALVTAGLDFEVVVAENKSRFLAVLEQRPDIILADYMLPDFDGMQALRLAQERYPETPFIFVSGTLGEEHAIESLKRGATDYVLKTRPQRLAPAVQRAIRESQERRTRREVEIQLREAASTLQAWFSVSPQAMVVMDKCGLVKMWSPAAERLLGLAAHQVIGKSFPDELSVLREYLISTLVSREQRRVELTIPGPEGAMMDLSVWMTSLGADDQGRANGLVAVMEDITERKQVEEELRAANRAKDHFLAVLSHELRTPLTPVIATLDALESHDGIPSAVREDLRLIQRNVELEARLIDDLLDLTRISKGKLELNVEGVDLHSLVSAAVSICDPMIQEKGLVVTMELGAERHWVRGDPARLQQVFWNLLKNAVKFTPRNGAVTIHTENVEPSMVSVRVTDTGIGIDTKALGRIFDAFEQGSRRVSRQFGGLGLGLAISRALVELHGGWLEASSPGAGKGATFTVKLGAAIPSAQDLSRDGDSQRERSARRGRSKMRPLAILLVEDHADTASVMVRLLEKLGHTVRRAASVEEGLAMWRAGAWDLLISDIGLPDGSGVELIEALRAEGPLRAIALSGFGMQADIERSRAAGFEDHLTKPLNIARLEGLLRQMFPELSTTEKETTVKDQR